MTLIAAIIILTGLLALARFASRDAFADSSLRNQPHDELGYPDSPLIGRPG